MLPQNLQKIALAGTKRIQTEAAAETLQKLGLAASDDPTQLALEALAAGNLATKAGWQNPKIEQPLPIEAPAEISQICPPETTRVLQKIFKERDLLPLLDEFAEAARRTHRIVPPEFVPLVFQTFERTDASYFEKLKPLLGKRGEWLAAQNPNWHDLFFPPKTDWQTGLRDERVKILKHLRRSDPPAATELLASTWQTETADDRKIFLENLKIGLGNHDLPLLERAATDRSREVRLAALELACQLPSDTQKSLADFFAERLAPALQSIDFQKVLSKNLPDLEEPTAASLAALLPAKTVAEGWRVGIVGLLLRVLPPRFSTAAFASPQIFVEKIGAVDLPDEFLENFFWSVSDETGSDPTWRSGLLDFLKKNPSHKIWQSAAAVALLDALPQEVWAVAMPQMLPLGSLLESEKSALVRHLSACEKRWTRAVQESFFQQISMLLRARQEWTLPIGKWKSAVQKIAFHSSPEDDSVARSFFFPPDSSRQVWVQEGFRFFKILEYRRVLLGLSA